jgi:hypothetical protein
MVLVSTPDVADGFTRLALAVIVAAALGFSLVRLRFVPRDLALTVFALAVAVLGIFAVLGPQAAAIGGAIVLVVFAVGAAIYAALALAAHWADR